MESLSAMPAQLVFDLKPRTTQQLKPPSTAVRRTPERGWEAFFTEDYSTLSQTKTSIALWRDSPCRIPLHRRCMTVLVSSLSEFFAKWGANSVATGMLPGPNGRY